MPITAITTSATFQLKTSAGYIQAIIVAAPGTTWTLKIQDGPDVNGNFTPVLGGTTALTMTAGAIPITWPLQCSKGIQVITSGTAGEVDIEWS
jgi:hypothetical protein